LLKVPIIAVVEVSSSLASNLVFSIFFALDTAMSSLRFDRVQGSGVRDQLLNADPILMPVSLFPSIQCRPKRRFVSKSRFQTVGSEFEANATTKPTDP
jgi:hypothetical protein